VLDPVEALGVWVRHDAASRHPDVEALSVEVCGVEVLEPRGRW
jgi:hypothetical protein